MLDRADEERMLDAVAALGWRYDKPSAGFKRPSGDWVSWSQVEQMWLAAQEGRQVTREEIRPESETIARTVEGAANDRAANDDGL